MSHNGSSVKDLSKRKIPQYHFQNSSIHLLQINQKNVSNKIKLNIQNVRSLHPENLPFYQPTQFHEYFPFQTV